MPADTRSRTDDTITRRFSRAVEQLPDTPEKTEPKRFSHGVEQLPDTPDKRALGCFSQGVEHHPERARYVPRPLTTHAIGYVIARVVKGMLTKLLEKVGTDRALHTGSTGEYVNRVAPGFKPS